MKRGRGMRKVGRKPVMCAKASVMSVTAALSPNRSNWGGRGGGNLGFLVDLFSEVYSTRKRRQPQSLPS
jgi:hypothetical protein